MEDAGEPPRSKRSSRSERSKLSRKTTAGKKSPIRKEVLHRIPTASTGQRNPVRKLSFPEESVKEDQSLLSSKVRPKTAIASFGHKEGEHDGLRVEKAALFATVKGMLEERSTSSRHISDVASPSSRHPSFSSPAKHEKRHRPVVKLTESTLDTSRQSEVIDQLDMLHTVLSQETPSKLRSGNGGVLELEEASRVEQQRLIVKDIKEELQVQFESQQAMINRLQNDRTRLIRQLENMTNSLSTSAQESNHLKQQIATQNEQKLSLQRTIADKTRQTEGLIAHVYDLRHQLSKLSESGKQTHEIATEELSKLQHQHDELKLYLKSKQEELVATTERKRHMEKSLSEMEKAHASELQQTKAELTRQINKLNRQVEQLLTARQTLQSGFDKLISENQRVSGALQEADSRNTELMAANEGLHELTDQYLHRINELTGAASQSAAQSRALSENIQKLMQQKEEMITKQQLEERRHHETLQQALEEKQKLQLQLQQSHSDVSDLKQQLQAVEQLVSHRTQQQMQSLTSQLVKKSQAAEQFKKLNESLQLQTKSQKGEIDELKDALHASSLNVMRLEVDLDKTQSSAEQSALEWSRLKEHNQALQLQISQLNESLAAISHSTSIPVQQRRDGDVQRKWSGSSDLSTATFQDLDTSAVGNVSQRLAERLDNLQQSYELHSENISNKQKQLDELSSSYRLAIQDNETLKAALRERNHELQSLQSQLNESSGMKAEHQRELEALTAEHHRQLQDLTDGKVVIQTENSRLKSKLDETLKHLGEVGTALVRADKTVEDLRAQYQQLKEQHKSSEMQLVQQTTTYDHEKATFQQQLDLERQHGKQKDNSISDLERNVQVLQLQCDQLQEKTNKLSDSEAGRLAAEQLLQEFEQQLANLTAKQSKEQEDMKFLSSECEQLQSLVAISEEERRVLQEKVKSLEEANLKLVKGVNENGQVNSETPEYSFLELVQVPKAERLIKGTTEITRKQTTDEVEELKSLLEVVSEEKQELQRKITTMTDSEQQQEEEMVVLRGIIEELRNEESKQQITLREKEAMILELQSSLARMTGKVKEMENSSPQVNQLHRMKAKLEHFVQQKRHEISELQQHYQTEIQSRELEYREQREAIESQKKQLEIDMESLQQVAQQEIQKAVQRLGQEKDEALRRLTKQHGKEIERLKAQQDHEAHEKTVGEVDINLTRDQHQEEIDHLQAKHKNDTAKLTLECQQLRNMMSQLQHEWKGYSSSCLESLATNNREVLTRESATVQSLVDEHEEIMTRLGELSVENADAQAILACKEEAVSMLATDVEVLKEKKERLQQEMTAQQEKLLETKLTNANEQHEELECKVSLLQQQLSALDEEKSDISRALQAKLDVSNQLLQETQNTLESVITEKENLEHQLLLSNSPTVVGEPTREQLAKCLDQLKELRSQHHQLQSHYRKLIKQEQEKEVELKSLHSTRDKLKQQAIDLKSSQMKIHSENEALKAANEDMSREHSVLMAKASHVTSMYEQLKLVNEKLKERNAQLQEERQRLLSLMNKPDLGDGAERTKEIEVCHIHETIQELGERVTSLQAEKSMLEEGVKRLLQQSDSLLAHRRTLEVQIEELEKTNQSLLSDNRMLTPTNSNHHYTQLHQLDDSSRQSVSKITRQLTRTKEKLKMKQRQANYLRLKLGATLIELRHMRQGLK
jgi:chromosome segregation ATPase